MYGLTEEGREILPRRYAAVLNSILVALVAERGEAAEEFLNGVARQIVDGGEAHGARWCAVRGGPLSLA